MARKKVDSNFATPWSPTQKGDFLEGIYLGFDEVPSDNGRNKTFKSFRFQKNDSDEIYGVAGATLEKKLARIPTGTYCYITYLGMVKFKSGMGHDFEIEVDEDVKLLSPLEVSNQG